MNPEGGDIAYAVVLLIGATITFAAGWWISRRWFEKWQNVRDDSPTWTMQQLRDLTREGQITDAEMRQLLELPRRRALGDAPATGSDRPRATTAPPMPRIQ